jgi:hypothetical protein
MLTFLFTIVQLVCNLAEKAVGETPIRQGIPVAFDRSSGHGANEAQPGDMRRPS